MYTITQAANRSGVAVNTIRAWERRYGVVQPARTGSGYRLYDDDAIQLLDAMRRLVATGVQPSIAAAELRKSGLDAAPRPAVGDAEDGQRATAGSSEADAADLLARRFVAGAEALDEAAIAAVLDDLFARGSFERVAADLLFPALERLGDAWAAGEVSVAGEHLASHQVHRRLGQLLDAAGSRPSARRRVLVGLPPGSRHELGALAFAVAARRAGIPAAYLGADLPLDDWVKAARAARAAVIGVPTARDRSAAAAVVARLAAETPGVVVAVGGNGAVDIQGAVLLPDRLEDSVAMLKRAVAAR